MNKIKDEELPSAVSLSSLLVSLNCMSNATTMKLDALSLPIVTLVRYYLTEFIQSKCGFSCRGDSSKCFVS